jgi:hypothetical protein
MRDEQLDLLEASIAQNRLNVDMTSSQSLNSAGYGLYERKDYANAIRFFREAAYVDPSNVYPHYNLACSLSLIRDSIWADPGAEMDYHHNRNYDYYATRYRLYEPDDNYYDHVDNDEICRNEIFEHLTLACLLDKQYLAKAPTDRDLAGLHNTLRFKRLMENIQSGKGVEVYGVWYSPQGLMKESYFMLDGSMSHILPNDRPYMRFIDFEFYEDEYINQFTDEIIQSRSSKAYAFSRLLTGYESFDTNGGASLTNQWDLEKQQLIVYSLLIIRDYSKAAMIGEAGTPEFDIRYFKNILKIRQDSLSKTPMEQGKEYINVYTPPYRYVIENDRGSLAAGTYGTETAKTLASLALIHDRSELLDLLIQGRTDIDLNRLFLLSCLFAKTDLLARLEDGAYGFDVEQLLQKDGTTMLNHAAASGNVPFFEMLYAKYHEQVITYLSNEGQREFYNQLVDGYYVTGTRQMFDITNAIRKENYHSAF